MGDDAVADRTRVVIVSGSVGAGHDGVARELAARLRATGHPVDVVDMLDGFPLIVRIILGSAYILVLRVLPVIYSITFWSVEHSRVAQRLTRWLAASATPWLRQTVAGAGVVVATYPPASSALGAMRADGSLTIPVVTYLTDPAPNFLWLNDGVDLFLTASRQTALESREDYGFTVQVAGPLVSPAFRSDDRNTARKQALAALGLGSDERYALVLLGSLGVGNMTAAADALRLAGLAPVVLCGRNARLQRRSQRILGCVALGWRDDVPALVAGASLVVHNAGGLALTESLVAGVPAVTFAAIAGHGRANARSLAAGGLAPWARTPAELTTLAIELSAAELKPWPIEDETACAVISALASRQGDDELLR